ncbi:MAG: FHA domain-containing protein [Oscillospiraceae bacterium]|nr:FHA domain-containing protein [Oscillospiraceae bacterium]
MNALIEKNYIKEMECGSNFSFVLSDNSTFLSTEYKVLQSQANSCFVKCMKMMFNGKVQLYYLTKGLKSFESMIPALDAESFLTIVANLFSDIIDVKQNGFLSCQNIDIAFERIYVDPATHKVSLVYLPLSKRIYDDNSSFENEIRTGLVKLISGISTISTSKTIQFSADLSNGTLSIEDLFARIRGGKSIGGGQSYIGQTDVGGGKAGSGLLRIIAMNAPSRVEITITKDEFVIGKKAELCDGVIDFNKMISRSHCRINKRGGQHTITDLQSANGTYVNKVKLQPNKPYPINNGDVIRLANSDFQVSIG